VLDEADAGISRELRDEIALTAAIVFRR
jgi:hypothetical protein